MLVQQNQREPVELQDIIFTMNKNLEAKHAPRVELETAVEDLWAQYRSSLHNYQETTEERNKAFEEPNSKDEKIAKVIDIEVADRQQKNKQRI